MADRRRVVVTGMGAVTALGNDVASTWTGLVAGRSGVRDDRVVRSVAPLVADRRRGARLRREPRPRPQGPAADRPLHPVRARGRARGARPGRAARALRGRARGADRGDPRHRARRRRHARRGVHDQRAARSRPHQPVPHPDRHPQRRRRPDRHQLRDDRPQLHDRIRVRDRRPRARRVVGDRSAAATPTSWSRAAPRPASTSRWSAASRRCARSRPGTTTPRVPPARSTPAATASSSGRGSGASSSRPSSTPRRAASPILAELIGYGATADASHITLPAPGGIGAVRAARRAHREGRHRRRPTSTTSTPTPRPRPRATRPSCRRSATIFGEDVGRVAITANKSMLGHTLGAAGAIEAIATILAMREGCVPPTINLVDPDPGERGPRPDAERRPAARLRIALSNSFGFGGQNTALIFAPVGRVNDDDDDAAATRRRAR